MATQRTRELNPTTTAPLTDVLRGIHLTEPHCCRCECCGTDLSEGQPARVHAFKHSDEPAWTISRVFCRDCRPAEVEHPTKGAEQAVADGWLASRSVTVGRSHCLVLGGVEIRDYSGLTRGYCK